eukprot:gene21545-22437_t
MNEALEPIKFPIVSDLSIPAGEIGNRKTCGNLNNSFLSPFLFTPAIRASAFSARDIRATEAELVCLVLPQPPRTNRAGVGVVSNRCGRPSVSVPAIALPRIGMRTIVGYLFAITGAVLFSTKAIAVKLAYDHPIDAETLLALRMGFSLPVYLVFGTIALLRRRAAGMALPSVRRSLAAIGCGLIGYWLASYTDFIGLLWISATFERLILFTYPLFVVLFGWLFFGGKLRWSIVPSFVFSYAGLALVFSSHAGDSGRNVALGAGMILVAALSFALYQLLAKREIGLIGSELFTALAMSGASIGALGVFFSTHAPSDLLVAREILPHAAFLAIGATIIPSYFLN